MRLYNFFALLILSAALMLSACDEKEDPTVNGDLDAGSDEEVDTGPPSSVIDDLSVMTNKVFYWNMEAKHWAVPRGTGQEFGRYVPDLFFQIASATADGSDLQITMTTATADGAQDNCTATATVVGAVGENPHFVTTPVDFLTYVKNDDGVIRPATMYGMNIEGDFIYDGTSASIARGELNAVIDFREINDLFHLLDNPTPDSICGIVPDYNAECAACPSDQQPYCITLGAQLVQSQEVPGATVAPVAAGCYK